jgi:hypothetical protein
MSAEFSAMMDLKNSVLRHPEFFVLRDPEFFVQRDPEFFFVLIDHELFK